MLLDTSGSMRAEDAGQIAVIIVSDLVWSDPGAVSAAVAAMKAQHPGRLCLHTVKVGGASDQPLTGIVDRSGCDTAVNVADIASGPALTAYVANTLLTPAEKPRAYETFSFSAQTLFDFDKSALKEAGRAELQRVAAQIGRHGADVEEILVVGHTDSVGSDAYNMVLSLRRANAVKVYLVGLGVPPGLIDVSGMGKRQPVASNETAEGRALNRRVDIVVGTLKKS